jgi:hypothetical protein
MTDIVLDSATALRSILPIGRADAGASLVKLLGSFHQ